MKNTGALTLLTLASLAFFISPTKSSAQTPDWAWVKANGGMESEYANGIAVDSLNNMYVMGGFRGASLTFGSTVLNNEGDVDLFLVKYDSSGNVIWARSAGGDGRDNPEAIRADAAGNVYITGSFESTQLNFGATTLNRHTDREMFTVKYNANGNTVWARSAVGNGMDDGTNLTLDPQGNVIVTGSFTSSTLIFNDTVLYNSGQADIYMVKYSSAGLMQWARAAGNSGNESRSGVTADDSGFVYLTGSYNSASLSFGATSLTNAGSYDIFVTKYDKNGNVIWARSKGGSGPEEGYAIVADHLGHVYVTGYFKGSNLTLGPDVLTFTGEYDMFIAKFDSSGNVLWANSGEGTALDIPYAIIMSESGNIDVLGFFSFNGTSLAFDNVTISAGGYDDSFIVEYDTAGNVVWAKSTEGKDVEIIAGMAADNNGGLLVAGRYFGDSLTLGTHKVFTEGALDLFFAKLSKVVSTGINAPAHHAPLIVYPNPNSGTFRISGHEVTGYDISVYSIQGVCVYQGVTGSEGEVELRDMDPGMYFFRLRNKDGVSYTGKIVVE
jgi:hypothetical protein